MTSSAENIKKILGDNIPVEVLTENYHFSELLSIVQAARTSGTMLTLVNLDNVDADEYKTLRYEGKGFLKIKFTK